MYYIGLNKTQRENATWEVNNNASVYLEQILEATPHKATSLRPLITNLKNHPSKTKYAGHCWGSKDEIWKLTLLKVDSKANNTCLGSINGLTSSVWK